MTKTEFGSLREKIAYETQARKERYAFFTRTALAAIAAAHAAADAHQPTPMHVSGGFVIKGGVCGFAWCWAPGNTSLGRWLKKEGCWRKDYSGGISMWCPLGTQSMSTKEAWCQAYVDHFNEALRDAGYDELAHLQMRSRID